MRIFCIRILISLEFSTKNIMLDDYLINKGFHKVPLERNTVGQLTCTIYHDDKPYIVIVDTGASSTILDISLLKVSDIRFEQAGFAGGGLGTSQAEVFQLPGNGIKIGKMIISDIQPFAMDISHVNQSLKERNANRVDGILGSDILSKFHAIIDYKSNGLYLLNH